MIDEKKILSLLFKPYAVSAQVINITESQQYSLNSIGLCYNGDNAYCEAEGRLYRASDVMSGSSAESVRGICPEGYHIPSRSEYATLNNQLGSTNANNSLKQNGDSGFEGFLAGTADKPTSTVTFSDRGNFGTFWSSTIQSAKNWYRQLSSSESGSFAEAQESLSTRYYSLRCIQDKLCPSSCTTCNTVGDCCTASAWSPAANTKCGNFVQTSNCGTTKNATGTIACVAPSVCGAGGTANVCGCTPNCNGKICGSNGCGGSCGSCATGRTCNSSGTQCLYSHIGSGEEAGILEPLCHPNCANKVCGADGCGGSCGTCSAGSTCGGNGTYCIHTAIDGGTVLLDGSAGAQ